MAVIRGYEHTDRTLDEAVRYTGTQADDHLRFAIDGEGKDMSIRQALDGNQRAMCLETKSLAKPSPLHEELGYDVVEDWGLPCLGQQPSLPQLSIEQGIGNMLPKIVT